jgi:hypothetical protein
VQEFTVLLKLRRRTEFSSGSSKRSQLPNALQRRITAFTVTVLLYYVLSRALLEMKSTTKCVAAPHYCIHLISVLSLYLENFTEIR